MKQPTANDTKIDVKMREDKNAVGLIQKTHQFTKPKQRVHPKIENG